MDYHRGDRIRVRGHGGAERVVRVWEQYAEHGGGVLIHDEDNYQRHQAGLSHLWPVAVPIADVVALVARHAEGTDG